jgi:hypothetical protein
MGLLDRAQRIASAVRQELVGQPRVQYRNTQFGTYRNPNAQVATHDAPSPPTISGQQRPFPGGAQFVSVVLNSSGNGQVVLGPQRVREHWQVSAVGVSVSAANPQVGPIKQAVATAYLGTGANPGSFLSSTATGSSGDTCGVANQDIQTGQYITVVWVGGDAGQTATASVFGTYSIGAPQQ